MTPANSLSAVSLTPANNLSAVSLTPAITLFPGVIDTGQKLPKNIKFITGINDTAEKLFSGVNDTADKFIGGVVDTGDKKVLPILACLHLKIKNKQKFIL